MVTNMIDITLANGTVIRTYVPEGVDKQTFINNWTKNKNVASVFDSQTKQIFSAAVNTANNSILAADTNKPAKTDIFPTPNPIRQQAAAQPPAKTPITVPVITPTPNQIRRNPTVVDTSVTPKTASIGLPPLPEINTAAENSAATTPSAANTSNSRMAAFGDLTAGSTPNAHIKMAPPSITVVSSTTITPTPVTAPQTTAAAQTNSDPYNVAEISARGMLMPHEGGFGRSKADPWYVNRGIRPDIEVMGKMTGMEYEDYVQDCQENHINLPPLSRETQSALNNITYGIDLNKFLQIQGDKTNLSSEQRTLLAQVNNQYKNTDGEIRFSSHRDTNGRVIIDTPNMVSSQFVNAFNRLNPQQQKLLLGTGRHIKTSEIKHEILGRAILNTFNMTESETVNYYKEACWQGTLAERLASTNPKAAAALLDTNLLSGSDKSEAWWQESGGDLHKFFQIRLAHLNEYCKELYGKPGQERLLNDLMANYARRTRHLEDFCNSHFNN